MTITPTFFENLSSLPASPTSVLFGHAQEVFRKVTELHSSDSCCNRPLEVALAIYGYIVVAFSIIESVGRAAKNLDSARLKEALIECKLTITLPFFFLFCLMNFSTFTTYISHKQAHLPPLIPAPAPAPAPSPAPAPAPAQVTAPIQPNPNLGKLAQLAHLARVVKYVATDFGTKPILLPKLESSDKYPNLVPALHRVANNEMLSNAAGDIYDYFEKRSFAGKLKCCISYLHKNVDPKNCILPNANGAQFIAIPVILKGGWLARDHNVLLLVDIANETLEYVNPTGIGYDDDAATLTVNNVQLQNVVAEICKKYKITHFVSNATEWQLDRFNCGVHSLMHVIRRCEGITWNQLQDENFQKSLVRPPIQYREEIINRIVADLHHGEKPAESNLLQPYQINEDHFKRA